MKHRSVIKPLILSAFCLCLTACAPSGGNEKGAAFFLAKHGNEQATRQGFFFCYGYGCKNKTRLSLSIKEWRTVSKHFKPKAKNSETERAQIASAIGEIERIVGVKTNTSGDVGGSFAAHASDAKTHSEQLDCVDEAVNTSTYIHIMAQYELIRFHTLLGPTWRGYFIGGWPHTAPVLQENDTGKHYVIDSWFLDNGKPASVVELTTWKSGWSPEE